MHKIIFSHTQPVGERRVGLQQTFYVEDQPSFISTISKKETHKTAGTTWQRNEYRYKLDLVAHEPLLDALTYLPMYPFVYFVHDVIGVRRCTDITFEVTWKGNLARIDLQFNVDYVITGVCEPPWKIVGKQQQPGWDKPIIFDVYLQPTDAGFIDPFTAGYTEGTRDRKSVV